MVIDTAFWSRRRVFLTGHTGFKGAWMSVLLRTLGAEVYGYAHPPSDPWGLFTSAKLDRDIHHILGDVRDLSTLQQALAQSRAEIVIHMAAQSLVRRSYSQPVETFATNVMGTVNVLEAVRHLESARAVLVVTSDKCYEKIESVRGCREEDPFGGHDPYSSSKACAEIATSAYRRSFFQAGRGAAIATARAGNVVGGGDWAPDRLIPDAVRAFVGGNELRIRNPHAIRPWQHVFDPVIAYLEIAQGLHDKGQAFAEGWNIGPAPENEVPVSTIADLAAGFWGAGARWRLDDGDHPPEAQLIRLDCQKARARLRWRPLVHINAALRWTIDWYRAMQSGLDMRNWSYQQLEAFLIEPRSGRKEGAFP